MPKRLAITIAGAVSLGSYEAGVLYELLRAIAAHNTVCTEVDKIYIDVMTGASAGGMTAAMVSQRLMFDAASLKGEFTNPLYEAWVERISLLGLVKMRWKEKKWHSLFSSDLIESIGRDMLVKSMQQKGSGPHPAIETVNGVPQTLRVGIALTNLNGIDYMIPILGSDEGGFNYTNSLDREVFEICADAQGNSELWDRMCTAAVASGAFPAAFRPQAIKRRVEEFGDALPKENCRWVQGKTYVQWTGASPQALAYSDGGVLQNQPLGIAKNLVDASVGDREVHLGPAAQRDADERLYVFVAPHSVKSSAQLVQAPKVTIWAELKQLFHVYLRQATFHDWINAEAVNQNIRSLDTRAVQLADLIARNLVDAAALRTVSNEINAMLMPNQEGTRYARLREQYRAEYEKVRDMTGSDSAEAFIMALATFEAAANLEKRDKMRIVAVIADEKELAGSGIAAFAGFFTKSFRQHDYTVGRLKTRSYLQRPDVKHILGVDRWPEEDLWQKKPLKDASGVALPVSQLQLIKSAIVPASIMILIRPALLLILFVASVLGFGLWHLFLH